MKKNILFVALVLLALNASGRDGIYLEFKITSQSANGTSKTYASGGDSRTETSITLGAGGRSFSTTSLILSSKPGTVYMLNESEKTYTELGGSRDAATTDGDDYQVTVIGKETVNDYNSTHVKVLNTRTQKESEMWVSKDVTGYAYYTTVKTKYLGGSKLFNAMKEQGVEGFVVRMLVSDDHGGQTQMDLVTADKKDIDASRFSLDGYTKGGSMAPAGAPTAPAVDVDKIQKMTPEERQQYINDMKAKYQRH